MSVLKTATLSRLCPTNPPSSPVECTWSTKPDIGNLSSSAGIGLSGHLPLQSEIKDVSKSFLTRFAAISRAPAAIAYLILTADISDIQCSAALLGFNAKVVGLKKESDHCLIIVGRDSTAVDALVEGLGNDNGRKGRGMASMNAVAGGVVIGAVATLIGLAFS